jgi:hypothetical protein
MLAKTFLCILLLAGMYQSLKAQQNQPILAIEPNSDDWQDTENTDSPPTLNVIGTPVTVRIFPNPAVNSIYIDHDYDGDATITLLNMQGQQVFYEEHCVGKMLNVRCYDAGVYWLYIVLGQETFMEQVIISK